MSEEAKAFRWTAKKINVAKELAEGIKTQYEIADQFGIRKETICRWKRIPEFRDKVDEFSLLSERANKAGLLRQCYKGLATKAENVDNDRSTHLDYLKFIADIQGFTKHKVEHSGRVDPIECVVLHLPDNGCENTEASQ